AGARRSFLNGVSCTSATACTAVGSYQTRSGKHVTLAERWNGTTWSRQPTPNRATPPRSALAAVSCTSASACTAVGSSAVDNFGSNSVTLAESWNGTTWSIQPTPNGPNGNFLAGVSCASPAACIAVGGSNDSALAEAWNGTSWSVQPTPATGSAKFASVSCTSPSACTAVGSPLLAERWDGTSWSIQQEDPIPNSGSVLTGVSCTTASACTAVGFDLEATLGRRGTAPRGRWSRRSPLHLSSATTGSPRCRARRQARAWPWGSAPGAPAKPPWPSGGTGPDGPSCPRPAGATRPSSSGCRVRRPAPASPWGGRSPRAFYPSGGTGPGGRC